MGFVFLFSLAKCGPAVNRRKRKTTGGKRLHQSAFSPDRFREILLSSACGLMDFQAWMGYNMHNIEQLSVSCSFDFRQDEKGPETDGENGCHRCAGASASAG